MTVGRRWTIVALAVGIVGLIASIVGGALVGADLFFRAYLMAYTFWLGLALGALGVLLVQFLTGGTWGLAIRRILEAATATLPLMAVLFVPLLFGLSNLYAWARPADVATDPILQHRALWLNEPFFVVRVVVYFATWIVLALLLRRRATEPESLRAVQRISIVGALAAGLTVTFAAIDWLMSLDADWFSTMYPPMVGMGDMLLALAFAIVLVAVLAPISGLGELMTPRVYNDLGSLLLAFLMLWAYMAYFQYLLIWAGNLSDEIPWYLRRVDGGWLPVALVIAGVGFLVPFWFLLFRPLKRDRRTLAAIAVLVCLMRVVDVFWLVEPPFAPDGPSAPWLELCALVGIGGLWLVVFVWQLAARPLVAATDPRLSRALEVARESA